LSKAYGIIRRFSEDVDLTYDIRAIASDLVGNADAPLPASKSQEKKWSKEIRARLSNWVGAEKKNTHGDAIDYHAAVAGGLQLVPDDGTLAKLATNTWSMTAYSSMTLSHSKL
jgi:hypothetical protein